MNKLETNNMKLFLAACVSIIVVCKAQVPHLGKCPNVTVVQNLDVNKYLGTWYEIKKFNFFIEGSQTCIRANYSIKDDGHIKVFNRGINPDGTEESATGDAVPEDPNVPAKLAVTFNGSPRVPYWIVDTNYEHYSLVWSCSDLFGLVQADYAWILSRGKTLDDATIKMLTDKLASFGIDTSSFKDTVQTNCPY